MRRGAVGLLTTKPTNDTKNGDGEGGIGRGRSK